MNKLPSLYKTGSSGKQSIKLSFLVLLLDFQGKAGADYATGQCPECYSNHTQSIRYHFAIEGLWRLITISNGSHRNYRPVHSIRERMKHIVLVLVASWLLYDQNQIRAEQEYNSCNVNACYQFKLMLVHSFQNQGPCLSVSFK